MNRRLFGLSALVVAGVAVLGLACGGDGGDGDDGDDEAAIRTEKGLSVAALAPGGGFGGDTVAGAQGGAPGLEIAVPAPAAGSEGAAIAVPGFGIDPAPFQQQGQTGITVQGFGSATVDADTAVLELNFGIDYYYPVRPVPAPLPLDDATSTSDGDSAPVIDEPVLPDEVQPITEAELAPVIDAIVAQGVARSDIEFVGSPFYDRYFSSATLRVTVRDLDALDGIVDAATAAAANLAEIGFQGSYVSYTVNDCAALEKAALQAAVADGGERGAIFADALGVDLGAVIGASHYIYSFYGANPCDPVFDGPYPLGGISYFQGQPKQVQLISNVSITYAIQ